MRLGRARGTAEKLLLWLGVLAGTTAVLVVLRSNLDKTHVALAFLLVVLGGSAAGGRVVGFVLAAAAFLLFNFLFLPPYNTLMIADARDWLVLVAFLVSGIVGAHLLDRAQERAEIARQRTIEVERLAALGAETLSAGRADEALDGIAEVIRGALGLSSTEVLVPRGAPPVFEPCARAGALEEMGTAHASSAESLAAWVAAHNAPAARRADGTTWVGTTRPTTGSGISEQWPEDIATPNNSVRALLIPLAVRGRTVGVLHLRKPDDILLDSPRQQFLSALAYYAALGVERVRLVAEAERSEAFRQADELKTALIATVSHDLRTPLTTIKALAHGLAQRGEPEARSIEEEADRLNRFVADLLDLSRLSTGGIPMRVELNSASDLVGAAVARVTGALNGRALRVVHDREAGGALLFGSFDFVQSLRVLVNVIENALKYAPPNEPVEIRTERVGDKLRFAVLDRGPGVPAGEESLIFTPFYRVAGARPDVGGAGLGLAIALGLATAQHGALTYAPRPGGGSIFSFEVPAAEPPAIEQSA
jgi:two-component system, OmpR family, sensor histidine kinase KdpD